MRICPIQTTLIGRGGFLRARPLIASWNAAEIAGWTAVNKLQDLSAADLVCGSTAEMSLETLAKFKRLFHSFRYFSVRIAEALKLSS
jgi:hypothetical protein